MTKTVDEKVVSMQFDNRDFEQRVQTTMTTLEKLKQRINLTSSAKSLDNISNVANKFDMSGMTTAVDTVASRFSALEIAGVTALVNLTNSAVNYGKRIVSALTIQPISTGFQEYETQMNAVQTILANTQSKGSTLEDVNAALAELNTYADKTIYNFTQMTRNIGTFTAAGVDLEKSVSSIKGIANLAAVSGSTSQQASTAMYQLSQALAAGRVSLMDWNSVVNAGMGGELFQNALKRTAENMGKNVDAMIEKYGSFRESLTQGNWLTTEVLTETLTQLSGAYTEADLLAQGYTDKQAKEIMELAETAVNAATKVKTFTQLWDTLKEAAQSGWAQTWQIILGDFEEAKELFTGISDTLNPIIEKSASARNNLLQGALDSKWNNLSRELENAGIDVDKFKDKLVETGKKYGVVTDEMIEDAGSFEKSLKEGWASGDLVTEVLDNITNSSKKAVKSQEDLTSKLSKFNSVAKKLTENGFKNNEKSLKALTDAGYEYSKVQDLIADTEEGRVLTLENLSAEQLRAIGYTNDEVIAIKSLADEAKKAGTPVNDLINSLSKTSGRQLIFDSIANVLQPISTILKSIGAAWRDAFPPMQSSTLYGLIEGLHNFTTYLVISDEAADKLTRTFKGTFAVLDLLSMVLGGVFGTGFKVASAVIKELWQALGLANMTILDITATLGDSIVAFRDWIEQHSLLGKTVGFVVPLLVNLAKALYNIGKAGFELPVVQEAIQNFVSIFSNVGSTFDKYFGEAIDVITKFIDKLASLKDIKFDDLSTMFSDFRKELEASLGGVDLVSVGKNIIDGLIKGLGAGANAVIISIVNVGKALLEGIKDFLGIHSPATTFIEIGQNVVLGLVRGIQNGLRMVAETVKAMFDAIFSVFEDVDFFDLAMFSSIFGLGILLKKFNDTLKLFARPLDAFTDVFEGISNVLNSFSKNLKARAWRQKADALYTIAKAIGVLVASLILLTMVDQTKLLSAGAALAGIAVGLGILAAASQKIDNVGNFGKMSLLLLSFGASMLLLTKSLENLSEIPAEQSGEALKQLAVMIGGIAAVVAVYGLLVKGRAADNMDKAGKMLFKLSTSLIVMSLVLKILGGMNPKDVNQGLAVMLAMEVLFATIISISAIAGKYSDKAGKLLTKMSVSIGILTLIIKLISTISVGDVVKGITTMGVMVGLFALILEVSKTAGKNGKESGNLLLKMSVAIGLLAVTIKLIAGLELTDVLYGLTVIGIIGAMFMAFTELNGLLKNGNKSDFGNMLLKISASIGLLAITIKLIAGVSTCDLLKGVAVIGILELAFAGLIMISKKSGAYADRAGSMIMKMSLALGMLAIVVRLLKGLDPKDMIDGGIFMAACTAMFAALIAVSKMAGCNADKAGEMLLKMTVPIAILAVSIGILSLLDTKKVGRASLALSAVMGMFAILVQSTKYATQSKKAMTTILSLGGIMAALSGIIYLLSGLEIENVLGSAGALSTLLLSLSVSMKLLDKHKGISKNARKTLLTLTGAVALVAGILGILAALNLELSMENALSLSTVLLAMAGVCAILSTVGGAAPMAVKGAMAFDGVVLVIGGLMASIGALVTLIPSLQDFLNTGISVLEDISYGLGSIIGNFAGGLMAGATDGLPEIGENLSAFIEKAGPFIEGSKGIDANSMEGIKSLASALLALTANDVLNSLTEWFTGGNSVDEFATALPTLGQALKKYADEVAGIDSASVESSAAAISMLVDINKSLPSSGGIWQKLVGEKDLGSFGENIELLGKGLKAYANQIVGISSDTIGSSVAAAQMLVDLNNSLPTTGGLWSFLAGDKGLSKFAENITDLGDGLASYAESISDVTSFDKVSASATALSNLAKIYEEIPNLGGFFSLFTGDTDLGDFGEQISYLGTALSGYATSVNGFTDDRIVSVTASIKAAQELAKLAFSVSDIKTVAEGGTSLQSFGSSLQSLGGSLVSYSVLAVLINSERIITTIPAISDLVSVIKKMDGITSDGAKSFAASVNALAGANISGLVSAFDGQSDNLSAIGSGIISYIQSGMTSSKENLASTMSKILSSVISTANGQTDKFSESGQTLIKALAQAISSSSALVTKSVSAITSMAVASIKLSYFSFYSAGSYLVTGFASGIQANIWRAASTARSMAQAAEEAAKDELDINSPSKKFAEIGNFTGIGFVDTLLAFVDKSYDAGKQVGVSAQEGISNAISRISDFINGNIDEQPTIRPVLDLSDVESSARAINTMFDTPIAVGTITNANSIGSVMPVTGQNGNGDVVDAINKLRKDLGNVGGNTYNSINGLSVDGDTAVSDAVQALTRAINIERRK